MTALALADVAEEMKGAIKDREFGLFQRLILESSGISLSDAKRQLLVGRLARRLHQLGLTSYGKYYERVVEDRTGQELVRLLDLISTNETHFFREPAHFDYVERQLIPLWREQASTGERARQLRVWSAASSTGQEAYSLAMLLLFHLPREEAWQVEVVGTDISTRALSVAASATWPITLAHEIPEPYLKRFMLRGAGVQADRMRAVPAVRAVTRFERMNLSSPRYPVTGTFDLIFCRNVLIYFTPEGRAAVVDRLAGHLAIGGYLFVGHAESLHGATKRLSTVRPTIYTRVP